MNAVEAAMPHHLRKAGYMYMMVRSEQRGGGVLFIYVSLKELLGLVVRIMLDVIAWTNDAC